MTSPKVSKNQVDPENKIDDLGLFRTIFGTFLVNWFMTPPKDKEEALTPPLIILKMPSTPPKKLKKVWSPPKNAEYGLPLKTRETPPPRRF